MRESLETVFVMVKPELVHKSSEVLNKFDKVGIRRKEGYVSSIPSNIIMTHLGHLRSKSQNLHEKVVNSLVGRSAYVAVYEGDATKFQDLKTNLREHYSSEIAQGSLGGNGIHSSEQKDALSEAKLWGGYLKPVSQIYMSLNTSE